LNYLKNQMRLILIKIGFLATYLSQYIGNVKYEEVCLFLHFVTGSAVCTGQKINVRFNKLGGMTKHPISHTCSCTLELPTNYVSYEVFAPEFQTILLSEEEAWIMLAL